MISKCMFAGRDYTYDTDRAKKISHKSHGAFGDPAGYEETLYRTPGRRYFVYGVGGEASPYPKPAIIPLSKEDAVARF